MRRRFFWGMVLVSVVTLAMGGVAAALLINRSVEGSIRAEFARQAEATAHIIETRFFAATDQPGGRGAGGVLRPIDGLGEILALVGSIGGHDYVEAALVGPRGTITGLGDGEPLLTPQIPADADLTHTLGFDAEIGGEKVAVVVQPFPIEPRGTLLVVIGTDLVLIPWADVVVRFAWAILLGAALAALLAGALARRLSRRVDPLRDASRRIADGDFGARVDVGGADEVTEVAAAFNEMAVQLEAARTREREFLVAVGHDLRTPLTTIAGYAEAIQEGRVSEDDLDRVAAVLGTESGRLRRLVEDLMMLARIESREFTLRLEPVDLAAHLKGVLEGFRERADAAKVVLDEAIVSVGMVDVDADRVAQVVGNLLENALRYTPEAGRVVLGLTEVEQGVRISVADTGPGIEAADLPHIFERLYVTARYRPVRPEGSGLGLSIVRELVDAMGGLTGVNSIPGKGTRITVVLPRRSHE